MIAKFKKGDLVVSKSLIKVVDDQTGEIFEFTRYKGIGIIINDTNISEGLVKIWWQKHPFEDLSKSYSISSIEHYSFKN